MRSPQPVEFVPIGVLSGAHDAGPVLPAEPARPSPTLATPEDRIGGIEITLPNGARVRVDALVNEKALSRVLRAMKGSL
jgi:transposase